MNSRVHSFKLGFRTSSRKVTNKPHGCGRLATSRSSRTLEEEEAKKMSLFFVVIPTERFALAELPNWLQQINIKSCN